MTHDSMSTDALIAQIGIPSDVAEPTLVTYRSVGIGLFGVVMRYGGMPLEKIALFMNSSQVSGTNQFSQAVRLTFREGALAPYRVVGPSSITAWFLQYSVMGFAFQFFDRGLSRILKVKPVYYGSELMEVATKEKSQPLEYQLKYVSKTLLGPLLSACLESSVSNRAEVERYFGKENFARVLKSRGSNPISIVVGPAFFPSAMRNLIMCQTTFILTPIMYRQHFPQDHKSKTTLFWFGLGTNIFVGNVVAITQQALWGRSLDMLAKEGSIRYKSVIGSGLKGEGMSAFFTGPKWFSRVMMNAPAQGALPWFYNEILPYGERLVLNSVKALVHQPFLKKARER